MRLLAFLFTLSGMFACISEQAEQLTADGIMAKAYEKAGGQFWQKPLSLSLFGNGIFYFEKDTFIHESHAMYRVYESTKEDSHAANGKVRIESYRNGVPIILLTFDGEHTYDLNGRQDKSEADSRWASNFGYGAIRHVFDEGYSLELHGEDVIHGKPTHTIKLIDPNGGESFFDIRKLSYEIVKVGFDTPRGWHFRLYSQFFQKPEYSWNQAGKVELYYNDKKSNEIYWTDFAVNEKLSDELFVIKTNNLSK